MTTPRFEREFIEDTMKAKRYMEHIGHADFCASLKTANSECDCGYREALYAVAEYVRECLSPKKYCSCAM